MPHPLYTLLAATFVAAAMSMGENRLPHQRLYAAARTFVFCLAGVIGGGWLMYFIHG